MRTRNHNHLQPRKAGRMQYPAAEDLQAQDSLFSGMRQIGLSLVSNLAPTVTTRCGAGYLTNYIGGGTLPDTRNTCDR